jgi:Tfp pilus assembly protein PilN
MKEIDLLPEWYKNSRRRNISFLTQYIVLISIFVSMLIWCVIAAATVSRESAEIGRLESQQSQLEKETALFSRYSSLISDLNEKTKTFRQIDSRIDVAAVLAELSFLMDERIVLTGISFVAEKIDGPAKTSQSAPRTAQSSGTGNDVLLSGDVRFAVRINGIAKEAADVAQLTIKLEESPYFCQVVPLFTEHTANKSAGPSGAEQKEAADFNIGCYLSNYVVE